MKRSRRLWCIVGRHGYPVMYRQFETASRAWRHFIGWYPQSGEALYRKYVSEFEAKGYRAVRCRIVTEE